MVQAFGFSRLKGDVYRIMCRLNPITFIATVAEKVLKIGLVAPYTGPNARVGEEFKYIHEMAFGEIGWKIGELLKLHKGATYFGMEDS